MMSEGEPTLSQHLRGSHGESAPAAHGAVRRAAEAVIQALSAPRLSHDALRGAVVRYGSVARDLALDPTDMLAALVPMVTRCIERLAPDERSQVESWVQWWAIHGYHRVD
ncbi:hypothetical protein [Roseisolibacter agri]|uniref:Uncharacterized protein n=1 Tax=Roseisolibacter agri TaxID=2014610 RepID=A0AA37QE27_9BACT|nr:hypothetical protein [Roseisolibacter agri]GLC28081.1 hypothetical protein rosag_45940 [Roseisolibacter agri]